MNSKPKHLPSFTQLQICFGSVIKHPHIASQRVHNLLVADRVTSKVAINISGRQDCVNYISSGIPLF